MRTRKWYENLEIKGKLTFSLVCIIIIMAIIGFAGIVSVDKIQEHTSSVYVEYGEGISHLSNVGIALNQIHTDTSALISNKGNKVDILESTSTLKETLWQSFTEYKSLVANDDVISGLEEDINSYLESQAEVVSFYEAGKTKDADKLLYGNAYETLNKINNTVAGISNNGIDLANQRMEAISKTKVLLHVLIFAIFLVGIIFTFATIKFLTSLIGGRINRLMNITGKIALGDIDVKIDQDLLLKDEIGSLAKSMEEMIDTIKEQTNVANKIAMGDLSVRCKVRSERDVLSKSINTSADQLSKLVSELKRLGQASFNGDLKVRGDSTQFQGAYKGIVDLLNTSLDQFREPVEFVSEVLEKMAAGEKTPSLDREFAGDYQELFTSLKHVYNSISELYDEINKLLEAGDRGDLSVRADASKVRGSYAYMINGLNGILDNITNPFIEVSNILSQMAKGDLTVRVEGDYKGDLAEFKESLNYVIDTFNEILSNITFASEQVAAGANQISDSSILLSEGSTEQASSIEELTASTEQIAAQTRLNAENAKEVAELTHTTKENAQNGNEKMKELLIAITEINNASSNISAVIKAIEDIAFQTNILALNAAVEAARAGQYGKGFAVVADEVKNLAQRSANAAKETTQLIETSIEKSENGKKIANETAMGLIRLVRNAEEVADLVDKISKASIEQANGIEHINQGIMQVSEVVHTNSATSEETAAASEELASQADILKNEVNRFKITATSKNHRELENSKNNESLDYIEDDN